MHKGKITKLTEGAVRDWGYALAKREHRLRIVTERESWILANNGQNRNLSVEENAHLVQPGYNMMTAEQQAKVRAEVDAGLPLWDIHEMAS